MTALDLPGVQAWSEAHGYALNDRRLPALRDVEHCDVFDIPSDAGQRVALVRGHLSMFEKEDEVCVWLYDWSVWPSGQWHHVFERFRLSYGVHEPLITMPGHLISKGEFDAAVSIVVYSVLMLWDCHVLGASGRPFLFYSHDEYGKKVATIRFSQRVPWRALAADLRRWPEKKKRYGYTLRIWRMGLP